MAAIAPPLPSICEQSKRSRRLRHRISRYFTIRFGNLRLLRGKAAFDGACGDRTEIVSASDPAVDGSVTPAALVLGSAAMEGRTLRGRLSLCSTAHGTPSILCKNLCPDAVLLDLGMPDLSGWEGAKEITKRYGARRPMLVAITGLYTKGSDRVLSELSGFDNHLTKPYQMTDVLRTPAISAARRGAKTPRPA